MDYKHKYLKYKTKYLELKGGLPARKLDIDFGIITDQTMGDCMKELIEASYEIYNYLLAKPYPVSLICGGQSPSYYCLAMLNFKIYNPEKVEIIILPHSKGGLESKDSYKENLQYCERMKEKNIKLRQNVSILDGVHSGIGILAMESALRHCFNYIIVEKISINSMKNISGIKVDKEFIVPCEPKFSDTFPRLIPSYHPQDFSNPDKFINKFNLEDNPIAEMTIDLAKEYPESKVEDSNWFNLNNELTKEVIQFKNEMLKRKKDQEEIKLKEEEEEKLKEKGGIFKPIITKDKEYNMIYQCPICKGKSGTALIVSHCYDCENRYKEAVI